MNVVERSLSIPAAKVTLQADVVVPESPEGVVVFAHGSGSSRRSVRNRFVAGELQKSGLATILADLLTPREEEIDVGTAEFRFDIGRLAARVAAMTDWAVRYEPLAGLAVGLFGASTGAAAALVAAAQRPSEVRAVVSRGGRPDLAGEFLRRVEQPTLLIVGERDEVVIDLNVKAMALLQNAKLEIVPRATHLFEQPGALEHVAGLARDWFVRHLTATHHARSA
jgi:pimeloyl-ACP methyl ester carboxylesterase